MPYDFASRLDYLGVRKKALDFRDVAYRRGKHTITRLRCTVSEPSRMELGEGVVQLIANRRDFCCDVDELILNRELTEPQPGDIIYDGDKRFLVVSESGEPVFRYTSQSRQRYRIHTKQVAS